MKRLSYIIVASVAIYIGCDPDTTHTMDEMLTEISKGIDYEGQTVTTEVTIEGIERGTANEDKLYLITNRSGYTFYILADKGKHRVGETYKFTIYIEHVEINDGTLDRPSSTYIIGKIIDEH